MKKPVIHLICNAHLDPVWQWEWEEGVSAAISTFRSAADLCEEYDTLIFNHNEVILYEWIEEYEPELFKRIQKLVKAGRWHIMGGWYLQPDCNMPSGEGFVRQILVGREYFRKKFKSRPTTAINFDPFGHTRGLVQILAKSGYDSYLHCRPFKWDNVIESDQYVWIGYDGSEIICTRAPHMYSTFLGKAAEKLKETMKDPQPLGVNLMLWGVGNHGGGPSRKDIQDLDRMVKKERGWTILQSTPEAYFKDLKKHKDKLPRWPRDLNPWAVGCYSSMIRIKQGYRMLENTLFMTEKMASMAASQGLMNYPTSELKEAQKDLLWIAFHDVLPGSSVAPIEEHSLQRIGHGMEILSRIKARAFFGLSSGQRKSKPDEYSLFVYNPHPWEIETFVTAEFNLAEFEWSPDIFSVPSMTCKGKELPVQAEYPYSNMPMDWRKRVCFRTKLAPNVMDRYDITVVKKPKRPVIKKREKNGIIRLRGKNLDWAINTRTGMIEHLQINGNSILRKNGFKALVMNDTSDPWGMTTDRFDEIKGEFRVLSQTKCAEVSGVKAKQLKPVRIIEDGPVRTIVEALYGYNDSILVLRWKIPKTGTEIELEARVLWNEKDKMLKLSFPTTLRDAIYMGDVAYGREELPTTGQEVMAQKWTAVVSKRDDFALTMINNGTYSSSFSKGEMRVTLLRSPGYAAHPINDWDTVPRDRFRSRIDQGERLFFFWLNGGPVSSRMDAVAREAQIHNEKPMVQWFSPSGEGKLPKPFALLSNKKVQISAIKKAENGHGWIIRLFEPTGMHQKTQLSIMGSSIRKAVSLQPFEIKTFRIDLKQGIIIETNLIEENV